MNLFNTIDIVRSNDELDLTHQNDALDTIQLTQQSLFVGQLDTNDLYSSLYTRSWIEFIDKLFEINPNIFKWKLNMRKLILNHNKKWTLIPKKPLTFLELYIRGITNVFKRDGICCVNVLTRTHFAIVKYFLIRGATATINISDIINYQKSWPILIWQDNYYMDILIGDLIKILIQPCYQQQCSINFDISFDDVIKCADDELLDIYLNIFKPNPQSLSLAETIEHASRRLYRITCKKYYGFNHAQFSTNQSFDLQARYIVMCEKLINYGVSFYFDTSLLYRLDNVTIIFLIEQRMKEFHKIMNVLIQLNCIRYFPKELITNISDMSLPLIKVRQ